MSLDVLKFRAPCDGWSVSISMMLKAVMTKKVTVMMVTSDAPQWDGIEYRNKLVQLSSLSHNRTSVPSCTSQVQVWNHTDKRASKNLNQCSTMQSKCLSDQLTQSQRKNRKLMAETVEDSFSCFDANFFQIKRVEEEKALPALPRVKQWRKSQIQIFFQNYLKLNRRFQKSERKIICSVQMTHSTHPWKSFLKQS